MIRVRARRVAALTCIMSAVLPSACKDAAPPPRPARIIPSAGSFVGTIGVALSPAPTFTVVDDKAKALGDIPVTITIGAGGGSVTGAPTKSVAGPTSVGAWKLGPALGMNSMTIAVDGVAPVTIVAEGKSAYAVEIRFVGVAPSSPIQAAFQAAKERVERIIVGDVPDINLSAFDVSGCGIPGVTSITETVDDLIVYARVAPNDGAGGILGSAGPCFVRSTGGLSLVAIMNFDVADLDVLQASGRLNDVILHELLHAVGFGTLWAGKGQISAPNSLTTGFIGPQARSECQSAGGATSCMTIVPLEACGGVGTRDVHWREPTTSNCANGNEGTFGFRTELMTGFISSAGTANPLSRITIASLADIGYVVDLAAADNYTVPSALLASFSRIRESQGLGPIALNDLVREPIGSVDQAGRVTYFKPRQ